MKASHHAAMKASGHATVEAIRESAAQAAVNATGKTTDVSPMPKAIGMAMIVTPIERHRVITATAKWAVQIVIGWQPGVKVPPGIPIPPGAIPAAIRCDYVCF